MLIGGIIALIVWGALWSFSENRLKKIPNEFNIHNLREKPKDILSYKRHLRFLKFSRFMFKKLPYIAMAVITIIVSGPFGVLIVLFALWFKRSMMDTNYKGYRSHKNAEKRYARELDDWIVIANQTIQNSK